MITCALPTYNNSDIIWLQLTALCNQKDAPDWELIVCEEKSDKYFGRENLLKFKDKLQKANCKRIVFIELSEWIPLGQKWIVIRDNMSLDSIGMLLCASDNYSFETRIKESFEALNSGFDWVQWNKGNFYNILDHTAGLFSIEENNPALFMAISKESIDKVNENVFPKYGVDTWLFTKCELKNVKYNDYSNGIHTDGFNTISLKRRFLYTEETNTGLFEKVDANEVFSLFPKAVQTKLTKLRNANNNN
jgi:hypothetical protein